MNAAAATDPTKAHEYGLLLRERERERGASNYPHNTR
jgi:hypothetical protein